MNALSQEIISYQALISLFETEKGQTLPFIDTVCHGRIPRVHWIKGSLFQDSQTDIIAYRGVICNKKGISYGYCNIGKLYAKKSMF